MTENPQAKRIVMCFDGTAQQIGAGNLTNVAKLFEMVEKNDPSSQRAYYDPGVGTLAPESSSLIGKLTLLYEQAFGAGLKQNVAQAYRYPTRPERSTARSTKCTRRSRPCWPRPTKASSSPCTATTIQI